METALRMEREEFINQYPPFNLINTQEVKDLGRKEQVHMYVHLPFCKHKCGYCYFKSFDQFTAEDIDEYLGVLMQEIDLYSRLPEVQSKQIKSLYYGGGTPTLLSCEQLERLTKFIFGKFSFSVDFEFCLEANPDEEIVTTEKLVLLKELKVRRISFGVQNFNDEILKLNKRMVPSAAFFTVYDKVRKENFEIINLDIMSGLLGETKENWYNVVDKLLELAPENIAFYKLEFYYNTNLYKEIRNKEISEKLMSNAEEIELIRYAYDKLQDDGGYIVSNCFNLAKSRELEHIHRKGIWEGDDMIGFGLSAHSCFNRFVYQNTWIKEEYFNLVRSGKRPVKRAYHTSMRDEIATAMVYGVKSLYMSRASFVNRFGFDMTVLYGKEIDVLRKQGLLELDDEALRVPRSNYIFADDICRAFFLSEHKTMMLAHLSRQ